MGCASWCRACCAIGVERFTSYALAEPVATCGVGVASHPFLTLPVEGEGTEPFFFGARPCTGVLYVRLAEEAALGWGVEGVGVEASVAEVVGEFGWAVGAKDFAGLDALDGFDELVKIGVIGKRQG